MFGFANSILKKEMSCTGYRRPNDLSFIFSNVAGHFEGGCQNWATVSRSKPREFNGEKTIMHSRNSLVAGFIALLVCAVPEGAASNDGSGLRATPAGIPWYVSNRTSNYPGAEAAMRIASSKWRAPWATKIKSDKVSGKFRLVSVNGSTYVVLAKMKGPFSLNLEAIKDARMDLLRKAAAQSGCTTQGRTLAKYNSKKVIEKLSVQVQCNFL